MKVNLQLTTRREAQDNSIVYTLTSESNMKPTVEMLDTLATIKREPGGATLKSVIEELREFEDSSCRMVSEETHKSYEVKTKGISIGMRRGHKIIVVKDQTVHEIRNPLNALEGELSVIFESYSLEIIKARCARIRTFVQYIALTLAGTSDLMLGDDAELIINPRPFCLSEAVRDVVGLFIYSIEGKDISLRIEMATAPDLLHSEDTRYRLILFHLLANAVKYTNVGNITVTLRYDSESRVLTTSVADTGQGINEQKAESLFKLYSNLQGANAYNPQGMGLGLYLCKKLSRLLGGDIRVSSTPGHGSTFVFTVIDHSPPGEDESTRKPSAVAGFADGKREETELLSPVHPHPSPRSPAPEECKCPSALIVEDDATNRTVVKSYLKALAITADEAENGLLGLELVKARAGKSCCRRYKVILMDINMPVMDGTEATSLMVDLFSHNPTTQSPIIAVTAANLQTRDDYQSLLSVGFTDIRILINNVDSSEAGYEEALSICRGQVFPLIAVTAESSLTFS